MNFTVSYGPGSYDPYEANLEWSRVSDAELYVVQAKDKTDAFADWQTYSSVSTANV